MNILKKVIFIFFSPLIAFDDIKDLAVVCIPVADATASSRENAAGKQKIEKIYQSLPYATQDKSPCLRAHQLLFNEVVKIKDSNAEEVLCEIYNAFYDNEEKSRINTFWTLKKNIKFLKNLSLAARATIPGMYSKDLVTVSGLKNSAVIIEPWHDKVTRRTYSAGTIFKRLPAFDKKNLLAISLINPHSAKAVVTYIEKKNVKTHYPRENNRAIKQFLSILNQWMDAEGIIPYVWGGCSYTKRLTNDNFYSVERNQNIHYERYQDSKPYTGFDCSGLILRAAQICGMPYFFKNTKTLTKYIKSISEGGKINPGDLIVVPGHVLIVNSLEDNSVIEAKGYDAGYGKLHEIKLGDVFKDVQNFDQLLNAYWNQLPIYGLNKNGEVTKEYKKFKILKLSSIWESVSTGSN